MRPPEERSGSPLCVIPAEILEHIAYQLTCLDPLGPPSVLGPLLQTCKTVKGRLAGNATLYSRIFKYKFDSSAVRRRAFDPTPKQYYDQLRLYCTQLRKLRGQVQDDCDEVLFCAYLMMLENDGRNAAQLEHAGLDSYLDVFVRTRLWDDSHNSHGWPTDNTASACALWLVWMTTTEEKLKEESVARRNQLIKLVLPYVLVPYRYASAFAPQKHFCLPLHAPGTSHATTSILTAHGPYPLYLDPARAWSQVHYSARPMMAPPLITVAAKLVYFSRRETVAFSVPPHLPVDRAEALARGVTTVGPTQEDILEVNKYLNNRLPEVRLGWDDEDADEQEKLSENWDADWWRLRKCFDPYRAPDPLLGACYKPGSFTGLWQGRMLIPSEHHFTALVTTRDYPPAFDEAFLGTTTFPLFMRIAEHHSRAPGVPVPCGAHSSTNTFSSNSSDSSTSNSHSNEDGDGDVDGMANAFLPPHTRFVHDHRGRGVSVRVPGPGADKQEEYEYATHGGLDAHGDTEHDSDSCAGCRAREEALRKGRAAAAVRAREEIFARVGLARSDLDLDLDGDIRVGAGVHPTAGPGDEEGSPPPSAHDPTRVSPCTGIQDIIFTGATDPRHGAAWNRFEFYGRVRVWDGMIGILRTSPDPRLGTLFFYGFLVGGHKFVGNWRVAHQDVGAPAYESTFSMARRDD
ncbi:hypothetical protein DFH06DRAFT_1232337 [Mycena polygramma]|nr:hypothetical protein DFH06DRAFT_1232337 [Mycena polygramma]